MRLWLIGMMGSGKSSAGKLAASGLGVPFSDTDEMVASRMGCSIAQLWGSMGEAVFRDMERLAVMDLGRREGIISTGGGVVEDQGNREVLSSSGRVVWLEAEPETILARLEPTRDRPGLVSSGKPNIAYLADLLSAREQLYEELASHRIATDEMGIDEVARALETIWMG